MCTATWIRSGEGYELFFTRDELLTRGRALPPTVRTAEGVRYVAPTDRDAGGTWIGANEHGLTLSLLNGYVESGTAVRGRRSRGALVAELCGAGSVAEVEARLGALALEDYLSFRLLAFGCDAPADAFRWDGTELVRERDVLAPVVSSSVDPHGAAVARNALYADLVRGGPPSVELLERFHASHEPERGPVSVCMHRSDARSVSLTRVVVDLRGPRGGGQVRMSYSDGPPCEGRPAVVEVLPLRHDLPRDLPRERSGGPSTPTWRT